MTQKNVGLKRVNELYNDRFKRALEFKSEGKIIIGYFPLFTPVELLTALDILPFMMQGDPQQSVQKADAYLEPIACSYVRSCFDIALNGRYDFLDGMIYQHSCDTLIRLADIWQHHIKQKFNFCLVVPHMARPESVDFYKKEILRLKGALEGFTGKKVEEKALREAIDLHNQNRALLRELYDLRKSHPPAISGSETLKVVVAGAGIPITEHNQLISEVIAEVKSRPAPTRNDRPRLMITAEEMDHVDFIKTIEDCGADLVVDDAHIGTVGLWHDVPVTPDPFDGLAQRHLLDTKSPRTYRGQLRPRAADLENRLGHIYQFVRDFDVDGVILNIMRFCDTQELEAPDIVEYLKSRNIPVLPLEEEYRVTNTGQIKTRVEAFIETIGSEL